MAFFWHTASSVYAFDFHHDSFEPSDQLLENEACPYVFVYVFKNKELTEIRVQYGEVGMDQYNNMINTLTNTYGQASFSRSWSDGSIVNYKLNSKYERYICGIKQKRIVALVISLQKRQSFYYFRLLINFIIKCYGIFLAHGIKCVCL